MVNYLPSLNNVVYGIDHYLGNFCTVGRINETKYELKNRCAVGSDIPESIVITMVRVAVWAAMAWVSHAIPLTIISVYAINKAIIHFKHKNIEHPIYNPNPLRKLNIIKCGFRAKVNEQHLEILEDGSTLNRVNGFQNSVNSLSKVSYDRIFLSYFYGKSNFYEKSELETGIRSKIGDLLYYEERQFVVLLTESDPNGWVESLKDYNQKTPFGMNHGFEGNLFRVTNFCILSPLDLEKSCRGKLLSPAFINLLSNVFPKV